MQTYNNIYPKIYSSENLRLAYKKARRGKSKKKYVIEFENNLDENLLNLQQELINQSYQPSPLNFCYKGPKTKEDF